MQESKGKKINRSGVEFEKKTNITDYLISKEGFSKDKFDGGVLFKLKNHFFIKNKVIFCIQI